MVEREILNQNNIMEEEKKFDDILKERLSALPPVIKDAISGAEVENHLRQLSDKHKLHLDQWQLLENEVMMTLIGMQPAEALEENIKKEVGLDENLAKEIANDIALEVFDPIRKEMERQLEHPEAKPKETEPIEDLRSEILAKANTSSPIADPEYEDVLESDRPSIQNEGISTVEKIEVPRGDADEKKPGETDSEIQPKVKRSPSSGEYAPGITSAERKDVLEDPYRESPDDE